VSKPPFIGAIATLVLAAVLTVPSGLAAGQRQAAPAVRTALPLVVISAPGAIRDDPKRTARMRIIHRGGGRLNAVGQRANAYDGQIAIEIRGHSSQQFPKKQYGFETRTRQGKNRNVSLLGLPAENDWILSAPYSDKTLMRNAVAYRAARILGRYASRTVYVELVLNGTYRGVYLLTEQPKLDHRRVAVQDDDVTGGYLMEMTVTQKLQRGEAWFRGPITRTPFAYADPKRGDLSDRRAAWIRDHIGAFERALYSPGFRDPERGYRAYLDVDAAVDYVLLNELFKNQDAFFASTFVHKSTGGKLVLGPLWDFDVSMGNSNFGRSGLLTGWAFDPIRARRPWVSRLYADPFFVERMAARWRAIRARGFVQQLQRTIDADARRLRGPQQRNFHRWPILGRRVWPNPVDPRTGRVRRTYAAEVAYMKSWLGSRARWLDANIGRLGR
jgi:hypothetical protein